MDGIKRPLSRVLRYLGYEPEPPYDESAPIYFLGCTYAARQQRDDAESHDPDAVATEAETAKTRSATGDVSESSLSTMDREEYGNEDVRHAQDWPAEFLKDFKSRIYLCYRRNFPPIPGGPDESDVLAEGGDPRTHRRSPSRSMSPLAFLYDKRDTTLTSDSGWGCMIRTSQMLLANALLILRAGRDVRRTSGESSRSAYQGVVRLFADDPLAPFSIHKFAIHGRLNCDKALGEWFGPSAAASAIKGLSSLHIPLELSVYFNSEGHDIFEDKIHAEFYKSMGGIASNEFRPTLILVCTRLGIEHVNPVYYDGLLQCFRLPQAVGIAGGRPSSSHYFCGYQQHNLFYLDPHYVASALPWHDDAQNYTADELGSCTFGRLKALPIKELDPSMLIGFLIRDLADWEDFKARLAENPLRRSVINILPNEPTPPSSSWRRPSGTGSDDADVDDVISESSND